jgi:hypothetical protein
LRDELEYILDVSGEYGIRTGDTKSQATEGFVGDGNIEIEADGAFLGGSLGRVRGKGESGTGTGIASGGR